MKLLAYSEDNSYCVPARKHRDEVSLVSHSCLHFALKLLRKNRLNAGALRRGRG